MKRGCCNRWAPQANSGPLSHRGTVGEGATDGGEAIELRHQVLTGDAALHESAEAFTGVLVDGPARKG